jgi:hypothetical protein
MPGMRMRVTLDEDVAEGVRSLAEERGFSFDAALNLAIRAGLKADVVHRPFKVESYPLGLRRDVDLTHALQLVGELEDEEILRKMREGK